MNNNRKYTISDIAREAGVSRSLVSSVLTNIQKGRKVYRVSEETSRRIQEVIERYDYHPNYSARVLRSGNSRIIGVVLSDISNRFFSVVSRNIVKCAQERGYMVMFGNTDENTENLAQTIELFYSKGVQGLIVVPCEGSEEIILNYKKKGIPIVLLDRDFPESGFSSVTLDNRGAAYGLTERLVADGHKKIELVSYDTTLTSIRDREDGYCAKMNESGLDAYIKVHNPGYCNFEQVETLIVEAADRGVEALVFATYRMALLGRRATLKHNISSPCVFACFNNADTFDIYEKGMYYIMQPIEQFAEHSVDMIIDILEGKEREECTKIVLSSQVKVTDC